MPDHARPPTHVRPHCSPALLPLAALTVYLVLESFLVAAGHPAPCAFRWLTGIPCPTCGATRGVLRLLHLDLPGALAYNPLVIGLLLATPFVFVLHLLLVRRGKVGITRHRFPRQGLVVLGLILALLGNWVYVIRAEQVRTRADRKPVVRSERASGVTARGRPPSKEKQHE